MEIPAAKAVFTQADDILGYSVSELCCTAPVEALTPCAACQPAIFTVSMAAMAAAAAEPPTATGGLSLGEFAAACAAGVFDFPTALRLVAERGRLMDKCCRDYPGGMAAVLGAEPDIVQAVCNDADIDVANFNCPGQIVISGAETGLSKACDAMEAQGIRVVRLTVAGAYHSRLMKPAAEAFGDVLSGVVLSPPKCCFVQNFTGTAVSAPDEIRTNLRLQICSSVRWEQCVRTMMQQCDALREFGPGKVLTGFMRRIDRAFPILK